MSRNPHRRAAARGQAKSPTAARPTRRLRLEPLEDRRLLAVITVDTVDDIVDLNDGRTSLREALVTANAAAGADEIRFDFGHDGPATIKLSRGALGIMDSTTISGPGPDLLTIDGHLDSRIFEISGAADVSIANLRLTRGSDFSHGGAIRSTSTGTLSLDYVIVVDSIAQGPSARGGGVYDNGPTSIRNSELANNRSAVGAGIAAFGALEIIASTVADNTAIDDNLARGGGIYAAGKLTLASSTVSNNSVSVLGADGRAQGGGIWSGGDLDIKHSTIVANTASSLREGAVASGGGLYAFSATDLNALLSHTIIAGNHVTESAADLFLGERPVAAIYSLIGDNDGSPIAEAHVGRPDAGGNLIGGTTYGFIEPMLGGLDRNGGLTRTHALLNGSPAISAGAPSFEPGATAPQFDQRGAGFTRRRGTRIDLGAVENDLNPWIVDSLADTVDGNFSPGQLTLREALEQANANPAADAIEFSPALFAAGPARILLTNGELGSDGALEIRGPGAELLTIDATGNDPTPSMLRGDGSRVLSLTGSRGEIPRDVPAFVSGVTLTGGDQSDGGAVRSNIELTLRDVHTHGNSTLQNGASVYATWLAVQASRFTGNRSRNGGSDIYTTQSLALENSIITNHQSIIDHGTAVRHEFLRGRPQDVVIFRSKIENNSGWGLVLRNAGDVWISDSVIRDNLGVGLAIGTEIRGAAFTILNTAIIGNRDMGVFVTVPGLIENSTISDNSTVGPAGGVHAHAPLTVRHSTIVNNHGDWDGDYAGASGGIIAEDGLTLDHTIVAGNVTGAGGVPSDVTADEVAARFSLIGYNAGSPLAETPVGGTDGEGNLIGGARHGAVDPRLASLAENGGPTPTHALLPGSAALDAGDSSLRHDSLDVPPYEQRWDPYARVAGARIDIGAYEQQDVPFIVDTTADESDGDYRRGDLSLREAIELANAQPGANEIRFDFGHDGPATILLTHGELKITDSLSIAGNGADLLTIANEGNDANTIETGGARILNCDDGSVTFGEITVTALTLSGGHVAREGGAIRSLENLTLRGVALIDNVSLSEGGAIYAGLGTTLTVENCQLVHNASRLMGVVGTNSGGGIYALSSKVRIADSLFDRNGSHGYGGGLHCRSAVVEIVRCTFTGNSADFGGGADVSSENAVIQDSTFAENFAVAYWGGGLSVSGRGQVTNAILRGNLAGVGGGARLSGDITLSDSDVIENRALHDGGGISSHSGSVSIVDSRLERNVGTRGGGIANWTGKTSIVNSELTGNSAQAFGGGVYALGELFMDRSRVIGNSAESQGGGIMAAFGTIQNSVIASNSAWLYGGGLRLEAVNVVGCSIVGNSVAAEHGYGGGLFVSNQFASAIHLVNNTITQNQSAGQAGGAYLETDTYVRLAHSTIVENESRAGGAGLELLAFENGTATIDVRHTIVAGNVGQQGTNADVRASGAASFHNNLIGYVDGDVLAETPVGSPDESGNLVGGPLNGPVDPLLAPLADNGGATPTHALLPGSPAIGAGDPEVIPGLSGAPEFDQRGAPFTRLAGSRIDIGAFEVQATTGALNADFNLDGRVDGSDFLAWQQNLGRTAGATIRQGDATADGDVDVHDLAVWRATFNRDASVGAGEAIRVQPSAINQSRAGEGAAAILDLALAALAPSNVEQSEHVPPRRISPLVTAADGTNEDVVSTLASVSDFNATPAIVACTGERHDAVLVLFADELVEDELDEPFNPSPRPSLRGRAIGDPLK